MKAVIEKTTRAGRSRVFLVGLAAVMAAVLLALAATADPAEAKKKKNKRVEKVVFASDRTTGEDVDNPTGDNEIFVMNPDGTEVVQITSNTVNDRQPTLSPDGKKIAFVSSGVQSGNTGGDPEIFVINADGSGQKNLSNNSVFDFDPDFSPDGKKIAFSSFGVQPSNTDGDGDIFLMNAVDGSGKLNLTATGGDIDDFTPDFSPNGKKIAYGSDGVQEDGSNPEGDDEVYLMNADGSKPKNLTNNGSGINDFTPDFSPNGKKIAYATDGVQPGNSGGDGEVFVMDADGTGPLNLSFNGSAIDDSDPDFSPNGKKIAFTSSGEQTSNPEGDDEVYLMNASNGFEQRNLTFTESGIDDVQPDFTKAKKK